MSLASYDYNLNPASAGDQLCDKIVKCVNLVHETPDHRYAPYVMAPEEFRQLEHATSYLERVDNSLLECINIAQSTLETYCVSSATELGITRIHYPSPNDLFGQVDREDEALLECINLEESTLSAEQQDAQEAKFNKDFDDFINRIEPLGSGPI